MGSLLVFAAVFTWIPGPASKTLMSKLPTNDAVSSLKQAQGLLRRVAMRNGIPTLELSARAMPDPAAGARTQQLDYNDPYHNEPYDYKMELREWQAVVGAVRKKLGAPRSKQLGFLEQSVADTVRLSVRGGRLLRTERGETEDSQILFPSTWKNQFIASIAVCARSAPLYAEHGSSVKSTRAVEAFPCLYHIPPTCPPPRPWLLPLVS